MMQISDAPILYKYILNNTNKLHPKVFIELIRNINRIVSNAELRNKCKFVDKPNLIGAFLWNRTPQGYDYWDTISQLIGE